MRNLPNKWEWKKLEEVSLSVSAGGTPRRNIKEYWENGTVPWLKISDLKKTYITSSEEKITEKGLKESSAKLFPKGTVIYSIFATLGAIAILDIEATTNQAIAGIVPDNKKIDTKFLFYCLQSERENILKKKSNATQDNINLGILRNHEIPIPPLPIQQKIVSILERAESLKQKREQANEEANKIIQSIFYEMFGDVENHEVKSFLDVFDVTTGKLDSNAAEPDGIYPFFTCSRETFKINSYDFDCEALLLAGNNAAAKYSVKYYSGKFNAYQRTYVLRLLNDSDSYKFFHFQLENKLDELQDISIGTNTKYLTKGIMKHIKLIVPKPELQKKFSEKIKFIESIKHKQNQATAEINTLFDALMQKAFKGELVK